MQSGTFPVKEVQNSFELPSVSGVYNHVVLF